MIDPLGDLRGQVQGLVASRNELLAELGAATSALASQVGAGNDAAAAGDDAAAAAARSAADALRGQRRDLLGQLDGISQSVGQLLTTVLADPCDSEPDVPLLLLPVRLETRFTTDGSTVKVRIYPDDVHVDRLDPGVSDAERSAGTAYWTAVWAGGPAAEQNAWRTLIQAVHRDRAAWVAYALTPTNQEDRPDPPAPAPVASWPDVPAAAQRAPLARLLPDRFVVVVQQGSSSNTAIGLPVLDEIAVGLPRDDDPSRLISKGGMTLGPGMEWMADYEAARQIGLGVDVTLPVAGAPVDLLLAMGVRASRSPSDSIAELRSLLRAHRFSDGAAFVPPGTPTNNTESDRAGWTAHPAPVQPGTDTVTATPGSNADVLGGALGGAADVLVELDHSGDSDQSLAAAANRALWGPSWATFLDRVTVSVPGLLDDGQREALRDAFGDHVRGGGPLPAIRLGNQPYGVLPVSSVDRRWVTDGDSFEQAAVQVLRRLRPLWQAGAALVPEIASATDVDAALLEILGSAPLLLGLRVRSIASETACLVVPQLLGIADDDAAVQRTLDLVLWQSLGLPAGSVGVGGSLGKTTRPIGMPLVDDSDPAFITAMLAGQPRSVSTVLQALLELALDQAHRAVDAAAPIDLLPKTEEIGLEVVPDLRDKIVETIAAVQGGKMATPVLHETADLVAAKVGAAGPQLLATHQPISALRSSLADVAFQASMPADQEQTVALQSIQAWLRASARLAEVQEALATLRDASTEQRRMAVAATLDCASHRLDAWTTAVVSRRLASMRAATPTGVLLGAYGWVQDVAPGSSTTRDGGYILAPSVGHAVTAGVLRSAYLHHNPDTSGSGAFAIDLSSRRVRDAKFLLEGIRNGQPLGALLGYRLERQLHEAGGGLGRFVQSLRTLAPLAAGKLTGRGVEAPPRAAQEAVAVTAVVDGVGLLNLRETGTDIRGFLAQKPANNPYLSDPWPPPTDAEWATIESAMDDIAGANDSAADLLLAEAVHQLVQGNTARAAATLDAAAGGDAVPVDPSVAHTPIRGTAVTHRLLLLVRDVAAGDTWATSARATAEPRLEAWARGLLGPRSSIVIQVAADGARTTLESTPVSALDCVFDALLPGVLESRIRALTPGLDPGPLAAERDPAWPAELISLGDAAMLAASAGQLLARAQAAEPASFARAGDSARRTVAPAALDDHKSRAQAAFDSLTHLADDLAAAIAATPPDPARTGAAVAALGSFGIAVPGPLDDPTVANTALSEARRRCVATPSLSGTPPFDEATGIAAGKALFGDAFWMLPVISAKSSDLFASAYGRLDPGTAAVDRFVRDVASVRQGAARYAETLLFTEALGRKRSIGVAQLAASGTAGASEWLGDASGPNAPSPTAPVTCLLVESPDALAGTDPVAGVVLDEWVEVTPTRTAIVAPPGPASVEPVVTTGLAANVNVPDARAPQALLLAISPNGNRWTTDVLCDVLAETLELAQLRGVTLERVALAGRVLPALQEQSWSLQGETTLDFRTVMTVLSTQKRMLQFVKD